jgi:hypothetical protein
MPPICPRCLQYDWLTTPDLHESARDKGYKPIICENCGWEGEADDLGEGDSANPD